MMAARRYATLLTILQLLHKVSAFMKPFFHYSIGHSCISSKIIMHSPLIHGGGRLNSLLLDFRCKPSLRDCSGSSVVRLFGSRAGIPGNPPGAILVENEQSVLKDFEIARLETTIHKLRDLIKYPTYDVSLYLVEDEFMRETNLETRGIDSPTDILSFPFHSHEEPGILEEPMFHGIPDYYSLGEMLIDVPYVIRKCKEDAESSEISADRGVSAAMAKEFDPEKRLHMLLVHGMLHLVGYDHETDDDYEEMVAKEEQFLRELRL